jgi:dTDP-4-amino-4,6-dideoxygalactose transaminase
MAAISFYDLAEELSGLNSELRSAIGTVLDSGCFLNGPQLRRFEAELGARLHGAHVVGVGSGTQALQVLLLAHEIGPGDDVVTTAASFYATAQAIALVGARPVFADVREDDYNLDVDSVRSTLTEATKAVLVVHLYGRPADMTALRELTAERQVLLLEDCAHAFGASVDGVPAGSLGDGAALSFYPTKNLGALGDAGAVAVNDPAVAERAVAARFLGFAGSRDEFDSPGISGRMDELQAACLRVRLRRFDDGQRARAELAARYRELLPTDVLLAPPPPGVVDGHHLFVIKHPERDRIADELGNAGVGTQIHYRVPLHRQATMGAHPPLPTAERWAARVLSLPFSPSVDAERRDRVVAAVRQAVS